MIKRYSIKEISDIWSEDNKLATWLRVELAHLKGLLDNKEITFSKDDLNIIENNIMIDKTRWREIENITRHDLQAFVQMLEENVPQNYGRWIHYGLTSSDILDTSLVLMCKETLKVIKKNCVDTLYHLNNLLLLPDASQRILGRTHGKAAEIQSYKEVFLRWSSYLERAYDEVVHVDSKLKYGKLSGAIGNNTFISKSNEIKSLEFLGLHPITSSQIISRDIFLDYFYAILKVVLAVEKIAYDIRIYSIDGVNEMSEPFYKGQKGSSAMPHKKNPILTENICGLTRLFKSYFNTAIENCTTLLERDISHSSNERIIFEDSAHIVCFILQRLSKITTNLNILTDFAEHNCLRFENVTKSQEDMHKKINEGSSRKLAHDEQQTKSM